MAPPWPHKFPPEHRLRLRISCWTFPAFLFFVHFFYTFVFSFLHVNTYTKLQLLRGEGSSAFLKGKFEPFSRYLAMGDTWRFASPSSCSPTPTLPRAASAVLKPCFFWISCLITGSPYMFFTVPCSYPVIYTQDSRFLSYVDDSGFL